MWNPSSYIAEVVGCKCSSNEKSSFDTLLQKSICLRDSIATSRKSLGFSTFDVNDVSYTVFFKNVLDKPFLSEIQKLRDRPFSTSDFTRRVTLRMTDLFQCAFDTGYPGVQRILLGAYHISMLLELMVSSDNCVAVSSTSWEVLTSSYPWKVGIEGPPVSHQIIYTRDYILQSPDKKILLRVFVGAPHSNIAVTLIGDNVEVLCAIAIKCTVVVQTEEELSIVFNQMLEKRLLTDFFLINEYNEVSQSESDMRDFRSTQVWNHSSNCLKVVKDGNSADGFHHLESCSHDETIFQNSSLLSVQFPQFYLAVCTTSHEGVVFAHKMESAFLSSDGCLVFSVEQCSPAYNHVTSDKSTFVLLFFVKEQFERFFRGEKYRWLSSETTDHVPGSDGLSLPKRSYFTYQYSEVVTELSFPIGDCCVVVSHIQSPQKCWITCAGKLMSVQPFDELPFFPVLCSAIHSSYGPLGVMCNGCVFSSHFPAVFTLLIDVENFPFSEKDLDGNISFYFFNAETAVFDDKTVHQSLNELPFSIYSLDSHKQTSFSCEVRGRLLRLDVIGKQALLTLSVSRVSQSADLFCSVGRSKGDYNDA